VLEIFDRDVEEVTAPTQQFQLELFEMKRRQAQSKPRAPIAGQPHLTRDVPVLNVLGAYRKRQTESMRQTLRELAAVDALEQDEARGKLAHALRDRQPFGLRQHSYGDVERI